MNNKGKTIKGLYFPMETKQDRHYNASITGKTFMMYSGMYSLPKDKEELWKEKGYPVINNMALARMQETGDSFKTCMHKTTWWIAMNKPGFIGIYTTRITDDLFGYIKFCITHGITVGIEDMLSGIKQVISPVANIFGVDLFKKFKVETIDPEPLSKSGQALVYKKRRILAEAREEYMRPIWDSVNYVMEDINKFYEDLNREIAEEKRIKADRYRTQEILLAGGYNISFFVYSEYAEVTGESDLDRPDVREAIIRELTIWAPAFEIDVKTSELTPESGTFQPRRWLKNTTEKAYFNQLMRIRRSLRPDDLHKLVEAYIQIQYYKEDAEAYLSDRYYLCNCGLPVNKTAEECPYCETINPDVEPKWESYNTTNEYYEMEEF